MLLLNKNPLEREVQLLYYSITTAICGESVS